MGKKKIRISVAIPTFNRLFFLKQTLASVFMQTEKPDEIVVVDNCSIDGTWQWLKKIKGIKIFRNQKNLGMIANWRQSVVKASCPYVVSLHSDDLLMPDYLKIWRQKICQQSGQTAAFFSAGYIINAENKAIGLVKPFLKNRLFLAKKSLRIFWRHCQFHLPVSGWTVFNKDILQKIGLFSDKYGYQTEMELLLKILPRYPIYYCHQFLFCRRQHARQFFDQQPGNLNFSQELGCYQDELKLLKKFEKDPKIIKEFSLKEKKERFFFKLPLVFWLVSAVKSFMLLQWKKAGAYAKLFFQNYPFSAWPQELFKFILIWLALIFCQTKNNLSFIFFKAKAVNKILAKYKNYGF